MDDKIFVSWNGEESLCERLKTDKKEKNHINYDLANKYKCGPHTFLDQIFALRDTKRKIFYIVIKEAVRETYKCE
jgi:hypothetical protein